jgi:ribosomal protein L19E
MEDSIGSKMVQANLKIIKKAMKKSRGRKAGSGANKGDKKNNLTKTWSWDPMLA